MKKFLLIPLFLITIGFFMKELFVTINIGDTYYMISYFFLGLGSAFLSILFYFFFLKKRIKSR